MTPRAPSQTANPSLKGHSELRGSTACALSNSETAKSRFALSWMMAEGSASIAAVLRSKATSSGSRSRYSSKRSLARTNIRGFKCGSIWPYGRASTGLRRSLSIIQSTSSPCRCALSGAENCLPQWYATSSRRAVASRGLLRSSSSRASASAAVSCPPATRLLNCSSDWPATGNDWTSATQATSEGRSRATGIIRSITELSRNAAGTRPRGPRQFESCGLTLG